MRVDGSGVGTRAPLGRTDTAKQTNGARPRAQRGARLSTRRAPMRKNRAVSEHFEHDVRCHVAPATGRASQ
eukprot:6920607-Prymnesium_polylepis.1